MVVGMTAFPSASVATSDAASPTDTLSAIELLAALDDGQELAWLDLREAGEFGEGHAFFAVPLPYSRLELDIARLVPRRSTRIVLVDGADGVTARAQLRLRALGYLDVRVLAGGQPAWAASGQPVYQGVNLPSKTFGERVEQVYQTPHLSAQTLHAWQLAGTPHVLLDGRTPEEHRKMTLPGSIPLPNGELALRWRQVVPDATTPIVVHCAGRTRSIVGAEILRGLGLPNPVYALENGTQGWALAGLPLVRGANAQVPPRPDGADTLDADRARAAEAAREADVPWLDAASAQAWLDDATRTTYVIDVRSAAEFAAGSLAGARHAPGGQLLQATDQHLAVRHARVLLLDDDGLRAPVIATWLHRLGWTAAWVQGGIHAPLRVPAPSALALPAAPPRLAAEALRDLLPRAHPTVLDLRGSRDFRAAHAAGATWAIRPRALAAARHAATTAGTPSAGALLIAADEATAALVADELRAADWPVLGWTRHDDWTAAGLPVVHSPGTPSDAEAIDYLLFVHDRHDGNLDAARRYLEWETGLIAQSGPRELGSFRLPTPGAEPTRSPLQQRRQAEVRAALADIRALLAAGPLDRARLEPITARLAALAAQRDLFTRQDFPPPPPSDGVGASTRYRLNADEGDDGLALYLNSLNPGRRSIPHNHTTWAVIVAVEGEEENRVYERLDDGSDPAVARLRLARTVNVQPGTPIAFLPDDIHSIHVGGNEPTLHFHLYGRPLETLSGRIGIELETGRVVNYNATQMRPSRVAA